MTGHDPGPAAPVALGPPPKSGRDWLDLFSKLAIPLVVLAATIWFTAWQSHLTNLQHQDDIMATYIGNIKDLLNQGLGKSNANPELSQIAEEQTITTLRSLNVQRNGIVLQFLQNAHLIGAQYAGIDLTGADLSYDHLGNADLSGIDLRNANLSHVDMTGADLSGATMEGADLTGAHLSGATLTGASLSDASLTGAGLSGARLGDAILSSASLGGASLGGADLGGADLGGADITQSQLDEVQSCAEAILSAGLTCQPFCRFISRFIITCQQWSPVQLTYWYTESDAEKTAILKLIQEFEQQHPGIHINPVQENYFRARAAFTSAAHEGNAPDVLRSDVSWTPLFASEGYLLNLDRYVPQSELSDYQNAPVNTTRGIPPGTTSGIGPVRSAPLVYDEYQGHLYGLPQETDFSALLFNRHELTEAGINSPPTTMDEFRDDAVKIVEHKKETGAKYGFEFGGTSYYALPFLYACGGGMFDQLHDNILVNNPESVAGLNFLVKLQNADNPRVMPPAMNFRTPPGTMLPDFMNGTTAMIFDGPHDVSQILTSTGSTFKGHPDYLGIAPIPTGLPGQTGSPLGGESYVISAGTAHPAEAYKFIKFMSSTPSQVAIAEANYTLPTRKSAYQDLASNDRSGYQFISKFVTPPIADTVVAPPPVPQAGYLFDVADPDIWDALTGAQSADEALNAIAYSWNQVGAGKYLRSWPGASTAACS
jgi:arabinogalactan oligomer / maltooligosaccharide transport system substrate-binding protein